MLGNRKFYKRAQELAALVGARGFCLCDLQRLAPQADIIINCTSVGMREDDPRLLESRLLQSHQTVFDIVYNRDTELLPFRESSCLKILSAFLCVLRGLTVVTTWKIGFVSIEEVR